MDISQPSFLLSPKPRAGLMPETAVMTIPETLWQDLRSSVFVLPKIVFYTQMVTLPFGENDINHLLLPLKGVYKHVYSWLWKQA